MAEFAEQESRRNPHEEVSWEKCTAAAVAGVSPTGVGGPVETGENIGGNLPSPMSLRTTRCRPVGMIARGTRPVNVLSPGLTIDLDDLMCLTRAALPGTTSCSASSRDSGIKPQGRGRTLF